MERITSELSEQFAKSKELENQIRKSLEGIRLWSLKISFI